jgi:hypothetical protein
MERNCIGDFQIIGPLIDFTALITGPFVVFAVLISGNGRRMKYGLGNEK